jgi:NADH dehydrogenase [ubiquinone] 1 alpha subcomplex assembly factor 5
VANLNLQWTNDLPSVLRQLRKSLRPDGMLLAALVGGDTLHELQVSSAMADFDRRGGPLPHVSPMTRVSDVGSLLQAAGFALPTVDTEEVQVGYGTAAVLMEHLQGSGDSAAGTKSRAPLRCDTMLATAAAYHVLHSEEPWGNVQAQLQAQAAAPTTGTEPEVELDNAVDTSIVATANVIYATGWAPHASQQQPKARGTAKKRFDDFAKEPATSI